MNRNQLQEIVNKVLQDYPDWKLDPTDGKWKTITPVPPGGMRTTGFRWEISIPSGQSSPEVLWTEDGRNFPGLLSPNRFLNMFDIFADKGYCGKKNPA